MKRTDDSRLPELLALHGQLLEASQLWSQGGELDDSVESVRHWAILINHARYVELIPAYQRIVERQGLSGAVELHTLINSLMFTDDMFKSYEPQWLESSDFARMTNWLGTLFFRTPCIDLDGIRDIHGWRERLKADQVFLTCSSGTSGRFSFVPRDRLTLHAMSHNRSAYAHPVWAASSDGRFQDFDCLILSPRGTSLGIQAAGTGLAQMAARSHYLFDAEMTADIAWMLSAGTRGGSEDNVAQRFLHAISQAAEAAYTRSFEFVQRAIADKQPILIFGAPFQVKDLCNRIALDCGQLPVPPGSLVVSGGGWKAFNNQRIPQIQLQRRIEETLDIPQSHIIDTYSTAELNCVFMSCAAFRYHIPPLIEPVVLDDAFMGDAGAEGFGTLGFLDPFAISYPGFVITGDQGHLVRERCACGLSGWSIVGEIQRAPNHQVRGCGGVMASVKA